MSWRSAGAGLFLMAVAGSSVTTPELHGQAPAQEADAAATNRPQLTPAAGDWIRVDIGGVRHHGWVRSEPPELTIETRLGESIHVPASSAVFMRRPCDPQAAEAGAWLGMFVGIGAAAFTDVGWGFYLGSILVGSVGAVAVEAVDCRRWRRVVEG
jgi:hypothetical protein